MKWTRWLPIRYFIRRTARSQGFLDPIELLARLRSFAQPSEVGEPIELLRAGAVFHARGLINSKVIQHNLDWVWPYWIARQYNPRDTSFMPRAFSISHINLSHRNWTAVGYPDCDELPIVDPRGLLTPFFDSWSLDCWIMTASGAYLLPSRISDCDQEQLMGDGVAIRTKTELANMTLITEATVVLRDGVPVCTLKVNAVSKKSAYLIVALRPLNPEGISFVHKLLLSDDRKTWTIDDEKVINFSEPMEKLLTSDYNSGDVFSRIKDMLQKDASLQVNDDIEKSSAECDIGLLTAAAMFPINAGSEKHLMVNLPLPTSDEENLVADAWQAELSNTCRLQCPEKRYQDIYDAAVRSLVLHSPRDVYPGPYTYKRFWFRDAAFIIHAMLSIGLTERAKRALSQFPARQTAMGYFRSQEGEWDANGEVLWILHRYGLLTGEKISADWDSAVMKGARWITRKRLPIDTNAPHAGLLPPGFSAEHLGLNDYYYWDDFWGVAGLRAAAMMLKDRNPEASKTCLDDAREFEAAINKSLASCAARLRRPAMPASPYRRLDAGAIGSIVVGYPLQACDPDDPRLLDLVEFLLSDCFVDDAFFQDMIHSGLNAYLTLEVAQILLRAGDSRYLNLVDSVASLATSTGQWPEAIHPLTKGGCMGDGHHVWAAAEWVLMMRNFFVREEKNSLVLCGGVPDRWLTETAPVTFGPALTEFGSISVTLTTFLNADAHQDVQVQWSVKWHEHYQTTPPDIVIALPGYERIEAEVKGNSSIVLVKAKSDAGSNTS